MISKTQQLLNDKAWARWTALILVALMMFFGYMFVDVMSPLQALVEAEKGWTPSVFGTYASAEYILNVCGFLILAGIILILLIVALFTVPSEEVTRTEMEDNIRECLQDNFEKRLDTADETFNNICRPFTEADTTNLLAAGYNQGFHEMKDAVKEYVDFLEQGGYFDSNN